jgi:DNA end-binding protein Ku
MQSAPPRSPSARFRPDQDVFGRRIVGRDLVQLAPQKDGARLKQQYVCSKDGEKVENDDRVKGYDSPRASMSCSVDELKKLQMDDKSSNSMNITEFVDADTVDRMYMDRAYFLGPDKGGERAFGLLGEALKKTGKVAIGQWAARGKQYLIMIRPLEPGLVMEQLRYADEVRSIKDVPISKMDLKKSEIDLAVQLIQQQAGGQFQPEKYEDEVRSGSWSKSSARCRARRSPRSRPRRPRRKSSI